MLRAFPVHFVPLQSKFTHTRFMYSYRELHEMPHFMWNYHYSRFHHILHSFSREYLLEFFRFLMHLSESCTFTVHGSHTAIQISTHFTQFLTENDQNSPWKSLHVIKLKVKYRHIRIYLKNSNLCCLLHASRSSLHYQVFNSDFQYCWQIQVNLETMQLVL